MRRLPLIHIGDQVFGSEGGEVFGAVREVAPFGRPDLVVFFENAGDFTIPLEAVSAVHDQKVVLAMERLPAGVLLAVRQAHAREQQ